MLERVCNGCNAKCCRKELTPVLLPSELGKFKHYLNAVETPFGKINLLKKNKEGNCVFLDENSTQCKIHFYKPLECKLYPFLLDFKNGKKALMDVNIITTQSS